MLLLPPTIFGEFGWHFLGIAIGCAVLTLAVYGYEFDGKLGRMAIFWLVATALSGLLVVAAAVIGATIMITSIMVQEMEAETRDPPVYEQPLPPWKYTPRGEDTTQPEDKQ